MISLETLIRGTCETGRFLDLVENFPERKIPALALPSGIVLGKTRSPEELRKALSTKLELRSGFENTTARSMPSSAMGR